MFFFSLNRWLVSFVIYVPTDEIKLYIDLKKKLMWNLKKQNKTYIVHVHKTRVCVRENLYNTVPK